jgi:hypothetical protein
MAAAFRQFEATFSKIPHIISVPAATVVVASIGVAVDLAWVRANSM